MWEMLCIGVTMQEKRSSNVDGSRSYNGAQIVFVVKSRREVKIMHHDKLKKCEAQKLPLLVIEYTKLLLSESCRQYKWT